MLDDIGTKAEAPPLEPSAIIETSPGNFQYHYFIEPTEDFDTYEAILQACALKGWTDRAALGCNRLFRLPGSLHSTGFHAKLPEMSGRTSWKI